MNTQHYIKATVIDEDMECSLAELCRLCRIPAEVVHEMINEGIIDPSSEETSQYRFSAIAIKRVQTVVRLQNDLRVNLPGCALALDLMEELEELRRLVRQRR